MLCSYLFMPVAYLMGVPWSDAGVVGELIGIKTFLNEFLAYKELAKYMENRLTCTGQIISVSAFERIKAVNSLFTIDFVYF